MPTVTARRYCYFCGKLLMPVPDDWSSLYCSGCAKWWDTRGMESGRSEKHRRDEHEFWFQLWKAGNMCANCTEAK